MRGSSGWWPQVAVVRGRQLIEYVDLYIRTMPSLILLATPDSEHWKGQPGFVDHRFETIGRFNRSTAHFVKVSFRN